MNSNRRLHSDAAHGATTEDAPVPALYVGLLRHRRQTPVVHEFTFPLFMALLDIDRIPELLQVSRLTSYNRWNVASYQERDHFGDRDLPLRERLLSDATRHGVALPDGPIFLLTHLRYFGYVFNPVSFYYCFDRQQVLRTVLAEVNNTFGGAHNYWLAPEDATRDLGGPLSAEPQLFTSSATKSLYVSPFMEGTLDYEFAFTSPLGQLTAHMTVRQPGAVRTTFTATLSLERRPWTAASVRDVLLRYPLMTAKVTAGIHWEALKLWRKGVPVVPREHPAGLMSADARPRWTGRAIEP